MAHRFGLTAFLMGVCTNVWPAPGLQVDFASWRVQSAAMYPAREHPLRP
jgi:hypothetical protein